MGIDNFIRLMLQIVPVACLTLALEETASFPEDCVLLTIFECYKMKMRYAYEEKNGMLQIAELCGFDYRKSATDMQWQQVFCAITLTIPGRFAEQVATKKS